MSPACHRADFRSDRFAMQVAGVATVEEAAAVAVTMVAQGAQLVELCGSFDERDAHRVSLAVGPATPVGLVGFSAEQQRRLDALLEDLAARNTPAAPASGAAPSVLAPRPVARVSLRGVELHDAGFVLRLLGDPQTVATMLFPVFDQERAAAFVEDARASRGLPTSTYHRFVIVADEVATSVGLAGLMVRPDYDDAEIWFAVDPDHRGRGVASAAIERILALAFRDLGVHRVWANCVPANRPSLAVLARAGFRPEGLLRESLPLHGRREDALHLALLRREWVGRASPPVGAVTPAQMP